MKVMEEDWQISLKSSKDRYLHLLQTGIRSDCRFLVGIEADTQQIIEAHKLILWTASPVFERMFYGSLPESGEKAIIVEDIEAEDFKDLLIFIYTNDISIKSIDKAQKLYYIATKYMVNDLKSICINYLFNEIKSSNVCEIIGFAIRFEENDLKIDCLQVIAEYTSEVIESEAFYMADLITLETIYSDCRFSGISEMQLFKSLENYAEHRFFNNEKAPPKKRKKNSAAQRIKQQRTNSPTPIASTSRRDPSSEQGWRPRIDTSTTACPALQQQQERTKEFDQFLKIVKNIRFLLMSAADFVSGPCFSKLLNRDDANNILYCLTIPDLVDKYFPNGFSKSKSRRTYDDIKVAAKCMGKKDMRGHTNTNSYTYSHTYYSSSSSSD